jgi:hypothetical protein
LRFENSETTAFAARVLIERAMANSRSMLTRVRQMEQPCIELHFLFPFLFPTFADCRSGSIDN